MNYNTDGFNERTNFINNSNDRNRLSKMSHNYDNSLAKIRINENRPNIQTVNHDKIISVEEVRGLKENFIIRNNNINNANKHLNRNMFKR